MKKTRGRWARFQQKGQLTLRLQTSLIGRGIEREIMSKTLSGREGVPQTVGMLNLDRDIAVHTACPTQRLVLWWDLQNMLTVLLLLVDCMEFSPYYLFIYLFSFNNCLNWFYRVLSLLFIYLFVFLLSLPSVDGMELFFLLLWIKINYPHFRDLGVIIISGIPNRESIARTESQLPPVIASIIQSLWCGADPDKTGRQPLSQTVAVQNSGPGWQILEWLEIITPACKVPR